MENHRCRLGLRGRWDLCQAIEAGASLRAAAPATAQSAPQQRLQVPVQKMPPELSDPRLADRLSKMSQVLGKALMNMPVGELEAVA